LAGTARQAAQFRLRKKSTDALTFSEVGRKLGGELLFFAGFFRLIFFCLIPPSLICEADMKPTGKLPALKTTTVGGRVLVFYDSVLEALGIDLAKEPADRPKTVTVIRAQELIGLSSRTINRMIAAGRAERMREGGAEQQQGCTAA
jgi:hypothetical protein